MHAIPCPSIETLTLKDMTFGYEANRNVFTDLSYELPTGKNIYLTGGAGNGQSTLLRLLAVLLQPQKGSYLINGHDTSQMSFEEFLEFRKKIGYTFDFGGLFANRTLHDNLVLPLLYHKITSPEEASAQAMEFGRHFGFERQIQQRPAMVSGGLRKLVCVLRAFILRPEMVVMDDPFTGVDPEAARKLIKLIHDRRDSGELKHVFFTSRDEVYPQRLGNEPLYVEGTKLVLGERKAA